MATQYTAQLRSFSNKSLQDNWWENRIQEPEEKTHDARLDTLTRRDRETSICKFVGVDNASQPVASVPVRHRHLLPKSDRVIPQHIEGAMFDTTYTGMMNGEELFVSPPEVTKLVHDTNFYHEVHTNRTHEARATTGFGGVLPTHPADHCKTHFETTNQALYDRMPKEDTRKHTQQGDDARFVGGYQASHNPNNTVKGPVHTENRSFYYTRKLPRDSLDTFVAPEPPRGKAGGRGFLVRNPEESGSLHGSHKWGDEYAEQ
ncbi:hypothetical protein CYMTET_21896 [Cymbomonas tetramitiformis]|uniref:Uncharacterized protein n=1 Tax=Cymbomonas tetramitiformis TaxID=36881 RepID=A0AAE0L2S1_9CHLO|nr:hypothetical protein CYMTET_21896 [Cymbomonas tetramitiformis]